MWGLMLRIAGTAVEARVPGWLMNAAATHSAIAHARRVAAELSARPERYGFDPTATYTAIMQSWDRAEFNFPSLAYGRDMVGHAAVELWPDPYYIDARGFRALRTAAAAAPTWEARHPRVAWRGSVTGAGLFSAPEAIPRIRLALACRNLTGVDAGLIGVHDTMRSTSPFEEVERFVVANGLLRETWPVADFGRYRFTIDVDGHANAWGLLEKLILGCCVLKVGSPFEQWYYRRLRPWIHYVPVKADLSDLSETIDWCLSHEERCAWIARNGARLAVSLTLERDLPESCRAFMTAAHPHAGNHLSLRSTSCADAIAIADAADLAEAEGRLGEAMSGWTRLTDKRCADALALHRRSRLLGQQGRFADAVADLERAVANEPGSGDARLALANVTGAIGRDILGRACLNEAVRQAPDFAAARVMLAGCCIRLDRLDEAVRAVRPLPLDLTGWWADLRRQAVDLHAARRAGVRAILRGRRAGFALTPGRALELAAALNALGRLRAAARLCASIAETEPASFAPHGLLGRIVARRDGAAAARAYLAALPIPLRNDPDWAVRYSNLLFECGDYRPAVDLLRARSDTNGDWLARRIVAYGCLLLDDRATLLDHLRGWMDVSPDEALPAELACAAQPAPDDPPDGGKPPGAGIVQYLPDDDAVARESAESWSVHHPDIFRHVFDEGEARAFLAAEAGDAAVTAFDRHSTPARAALLGHAWLHRHGGVWIAADRRCLRPAGGFLAALASAEIAAVRSGELCFGSLEDGIVGARRGSAVAEAVLRAMVGGGAAPTSGILTRAVASHLCERGADGVLLFAPVQAARFCAGVRR